MIRIGAKTAGQAVRTKIIYILRSAVVNRITIKKKNQAGCVNGITETRPVFAENQEILFLFSLFNLNRKAFNLIKPSASL